MIQRDNNRSIIFVGEEDCQFYLRKLEAACQQFQCDLHAYVLMTNHVHLLITPHMKGGIGKVMQTLGRYYVQYLFINTNESRDRLNQSHVEVIGDHRKQEKTIVYDPH